MNRLTSFILVPLFFIIASCATVKQPQVSLPEKQGIDEKSNGKSISSVLYEELKHTAFELKKAFLEGKRVDQDEPWGRFMGTVYEKEALNLQASLCERARYLECAGRAYSRLMGTYPLDQSGYAGAMNLLIEKRAYHEAGEVARQAKERIETINSPQLLNSMAMLAIVRGDGESAGSLLMKAKAKGLGRRIFSYNMAMALKLQGQDKDAERLLSQDMKSDPGDPLVAMALRKTGSVKRLYYTRKDDFPEETRSMMALYLASWAVGKDDLDRAEMLINDPVVMKESRADGLIVEGNILFQKGKFLEAVGKYNEAIEIDPNLHESYYNIGLISEIYLGDFKKAEESYQRYIELGGREKEKVVRLLENLRMVRLKK